LYLSQFQAAGLAVSAHGLITGSSGNLSIRLKDRLIITRHGSVLSSLNESDLIETGIYTDDSVTPMASWELPVHRAVYIGTTASCLVHAHPPRAVSLTLTDEKVDIPGGVAVLGMSTGIVPGVLAAEIARELGKHPLVMVKGHGSFASGKTLEEACELTLSFEDSCKRTCIQYSIPIKRAVE
jgi:L-fuculose-phosphate aldolase